MSGVEKRLDIPFTLCYRAIEYHLLKSDGVKGGEEGHKGKFL